MRSVGRDVGGAGGLSGSPCGGYGLGTMCLASGGVGVERFGAHLAYLHLSSRPGTARFDGSPGPGVFRALLLEAREHVLGAVGRPKRQCFVVLSVQSNLRLLNHVPGER